MRQLLWVCVALAGCDSGVAPPRHTKTDEAMVKMTAFQDQMCACKDSDCVQRVSNAMTMWAQDKSNAQPERPKLSDEDTKRFTKIGEEMAKCMQKAMAGPGEYRTQAGG
jgi:hypothetical protein